MSQLIGPLVELSVGELNLCAVKIAACKGDRGGRFLGLCGKPVVSALKRQIDLGLIDLCE